MASAANDSPDTLRAAPRHPAVLVAMAFGIGIFVDARLADATAGLWAALTAASLVLMVLAAFSRRVGFLSLAVLIFWFHLGGFRHHLALRVAEPNDIRFFCGERSRLVQLRGVIETSPTVRRASGSPFQAAWSQIDRSSCLLQCREILGEKTIPVRGLARLSVDGHLAQVEVGDLVEVTGWLSQPLPPANPGEFDFAEWLRRQGAGCQITADHPGVVRRIGPSPGFFWTLRRLNARLREEGELLFRNRLSPKTSPIASALLLGDRSGLTDDLRTAFAESGMTHLLAISGMNVAILAALVWPFLRLFRASPATTAVTLVLITAGYACLADGGPPVVRAALLVATMAATMPFHRQTSGANGLAVAAWILLMFRPQDLFDVGAQLSFLAVAGMVWVGRWPRRTRKDDDDLIERTLFSRIVRTIGTAAGDSCRLMAGIWIFTLPLVIHAFHLVSPAGLLLNIVLIPFVTVVLWIGYLMLVAGLAFGPLAALFAGPFDAGLTVFLRAVEWAAVVKQGHFYVAPPPIAWTASYYLIVAGLFLIPGRSMQKRLVFTAVAWIVLGLGLGLHIPRQDALRCTFLSVGHGAAVVVETPNGATLLYDAGSLQSPERAERAVQAYLWSRGKTGIDAIAVSHADIDHFNGVPGLLRSMPVGKLLAARSFLDFRQEAVRATCEAAFEQGVPIRLIQSDDRLVIDDQVRIRVVHPPGTRWAANPSDNASSVVLQIEFGGRTILLTGDLEKEGLERLLTSDAMKLDVLQSPHHGSLTSNPERLGRWAQPQFVVASAGPRDTSDQLQKNYGPDCRVLHTSEAGAITLVIQPDGSLAVQTVRGADGMRSPSLRDKTAGQ